MKTQKQFILAHLKHYGKITSYEAFQKYKILRLAALIFDLRQVGYKIKSTIGKGYNAHYVVYNLIQESKDA